jgi:hypothetical protein
MRPFIVATCAIGFWLLLSTSVAGAPGSAAGAKTPNPFAPPPATSSPVTFEAYERLAAQILAGDAIAYSRDGYFMAANTRQTIGGEETEVMMQKVVISGADREHEEGSWIVNVLDFRVRTASASADIALVAAALQSNSFASSSVKKWPCSNNECRLWPGTKLRFKGSVLTEVVRRGNRSVSGKIGIHLVDKGFGVHPIRAWAEENSCVKSVTFEKSAHLSGHDVTVSHTTVHFLVCDID